jgi:DNA-binding NtrC family response regulator
VTPVDSPGPRRRTAEGGFTVLIVDDERTLARSIRLFLEEAGYGAEVAEDGARAMQLLESLQPDLVFLDVALPDVSGIDLLRRIRERDPSLPVVVMTAYGSIEGAVEAVQLGAFHYLKKPVDLDQLKLLADRARESAVLREELSYYRGRAARGSAAPVLVGDSPGFRAMVDRARELAALDDTPPILLTGETGTGKGILARNIHAASARAGRPFVEIDCTALPASLMEAELFGHERGAFTDAREARMGLFEAADGGFVFLDEVGDLESGLQGKLLRAIEERTVRRVGGVRDRRIDVRILAATNRELTRDVEAQRFRKDLYYRLAVLVLHLPPLRERGRDVLLLAEHFARRFSAKYGRPFRGFAEGVERRLQDYTWPGNVRELSHVVERGVLWTQGGLVDVEALSTPKPVSQAAGGRGAPTTVLESDRAAQVPDARGNAAGTDGSQAAASNGAIAPLPPPGVDLASWERSVLEQALREAGGNQTRAARRLGITRDTLRYRIKKFGLGD